MRNGAREGNTSGTWILTYCSLNFAYLSCKFFGNSFPKAHPCLPISQHKIQSPLPWSSPPTTPDWAPASLAAHLSARQPSAASVLFLSHAKHVPPQGLCTCCSAARSAVSTCLFCSATSLLLCLSAQMPPPQQGIPWPLQKNARSLAQLPSPGWMASPHNRHSLALFSCWLPSSLLGCELPERKPLSSSLDAQYLAPWVGT